MGAFPVLDELNRLGNSLNGLAVIVTLFTIPSILLFYFTFWKSRKRLWRQVKGLSKVAGGYIASCFSADYKKRYGEWRKTHLVAELKKLVHYRRPHEMDSFGRIFSRLASTASIFLVLCIYVAFWAFFCIGIALAILEREILKLPVSPIHPSVAQKVVIYANLAVFWLSLYAFIMNLADIQSEAAKLSPAIRSKRLKAVKKKLRKYNVDVEETLRSFAAKAPTSAP